MSPLTRYLGPASREDGSEEIHVDDVVLRKGGGAEDLSDSQLQRVKDLPGQRFEVEGQGSGPEFTSDAAREKALEADLDVSELQGSAKDGRITVADVETAIEDAD